MNKLLDSTAEENHIANANKADVVVPISLLQRIGVHMHRVSAPVMPRLKDTLSDRQALGSFFLLLAIVSFSVFGGYTLGIQNATMRPELVIIPANFTEADRRAKLHGQSEQLEVSNQLGRLRAELLRLHSVFTHLAEIAELDDGEFEFTSPLLEWQDQSNAQQLGLLNQHIAHMSDSSEMLNTIFDIRRMVHDQRVSGRPLVTGQRSSGFGYRTDPITGARVQHQGLDFSGAPGEPVLALADGIVTFSGKNAGYGNLVELEHVDGLRTRYAHNRTNVVDRGTRVRKGEVIAKLGSTGRSTGPHVHIEVRLDGSPIDPGFFIR